ncbi:MAG: hypothetical protein MRZ79_24605 [Bacteroidia bacterium]|nr:hypothetical protein [Bacteroidia bacterium]
MKPTFTLFILLFCSSLLFGQNNLFIPFGQTKAEVRRYLDSRDYISSIVEDKELHSLRAQLDAKKHVEYVFKNETLYATTVSRIYNDKKLAKEIQKNVLDYMDYVSGKNGILQNNKNGISVYTIGIDSRVIKLFVQQQTTHTTLTLTSISKDQLPSDDDSKILYELELLQKSFISN